MLHQRHKIAKYSAKSALRKLEIFGAFYEERKKYFLKSFLKLGELGDHLNSFSKSMSIEVSQHDPDAIRLRDRKNGPSKKDSVNSTEC